jgi:hypothetical protein
MQDDVGDAPDHVNNPPRLQILRSPRDLLLLLTWFVYTPTVPEERVFGFLWCSKSPFMGLMSHNHPPATQGLGYYGPASTAPPCLLYLALLYSLPLPRLAYWLDFPPMQVAAPLIPGIAPRRVIASEVRHAQD